MIRLRKLLWKIGDQFIPYIYRVAATTGKPEDKAEGAIAVINAFNLANFIKDMREQNGRDADMYIRIHYIDQINPKDSTQFTWGVTDPLLIN